MRLPFSLPFSTFPLLRPHLLSHLLSLTLRICLLSTSLQTLPVPDHPSPPDYRVTRPSSILDHEQPPGPLLALARWFERHQLGRWPTVPALRGSSSSLVRRSCMVSFEWANLLRFPHICQSKLIKLFRHCQIVQHVGFCPEHGNSTL